MKDITLRQIAEAAGVSLSAASRAINQQPRVSREVRRKVLACAEKLHYEFDGGIGGRKHIAILAPEVLSLQTDIYSNLLIASLFNILGKQGYLVHMINSETLLNTDFFAVLTLDALNAVSLEWGRQHGMPLIAFNMQGHQKEDIYSISSNERQGMEIAVDVLWKAGHRRIGLLIGGNSKTPASMERISGFRNSMMQRGIPDASIEISPLDREFYESVGNLIRTGVTSIIIPGEGIGQKVFYALSLFRFRIPEDISLISWEVPVYSENWMPGLTTIGQDFDEMARRAGEILSMLCKRQSPPYRQVVDYLYYARKSVAPAQSARQ